MITSINFGQLRHSEVIQFFDSIASLCAANNPEKLKIITPLQAFIDANKKVNESFKPSLYSTITKKLEELDARRDEAIVCLRKIADGYTNHFDVKKQKAGETLIKVIDKYGSSLSRLNFQAETSTLTNLGDELKTTPSLQKAIALTSLTEVLDEMVESNDLFKEQYLARVQETVAKKQNATGTLIVDSVATYRTMVKHIEAHATITPSIAYTALIKEMNDMIDRFKLTITQRTEKKDKSLN